MGHRHRGWLAAGGAALVLAAVAATGLARRSVVAESAQFVVFAMAGPALIVLGAPWRLARLSQAAEPAPGLPGPARTAPLDRLAVARRARASLPRSAAVLGVFIAVSVAWRLPPVMDAVSQHPALVLPELVTLVPAGTALWLELVSSPPLAPRLPNPHRAALAALAMWSAWAVAYVLGLSSHAVFRAYDGPGSGLSAAADQQLAVALVWAVSAFCFLPVIFAGLLGWLRDTGDEPRRLAGEGRQHPVVRGWGRPVRGGRNG
jgi:cytochrome c oxidase assembly factor CtaG